MFDDEVFGAIADERRQLAAIFADFGPDQWSTQSLCGAWSVREVAGHLVVPLIVPMWRFGLAMAMARGNFDRANRDMARTVARTRGDRLPELLAEHADKRFTPPGHGPLAPLTDVVVHGQDILRPLGMTKPIDPERLRAVLDHSVDDADAAMRRRLDTPLRWEATDLDWSHGLGPVVCGPAISLALIMTGRTIALEDTSGDGSEMLAAALPDR